MSAAIAPGSATLRSVGSAALAVSRNRGKRSCSIEHVERKAPELYRMKDGQWLEASEEEVLAHAQNLVSQRLRRGFPVLRERRRLHNYLRVQMGALEQVQFGMLLLTARYRLIAFRMLFRGTIDDVNVHIREIVRDAIDLNAANVILVRNSPADEVELSMRDSSIFERAREVNARVSSERKSRARGSPGPAAQLH